MNVNDLKRGRFLTQKDVQKPVLVTITGYREFNVALEGAEEDLRWTLSFREFEKPLVLNSTNGQIIAAIMGSDEAEDWIGKKIVLYIEPSVSYGGRVTGGIRVRAVRNQPASPQKAPEANPEPQTLGTPNPEYKEGAAPEDDIDPETGRKIPF